MATIFTNREQSRKERAALARIRACYPDMSYTCLAKAIVDTTNRTVAGADVDYIRKMVKPYYGILGVLRTLGVK